MNRDELNAKASELGIADPESFDTKAEVEAAIEAAEAAPEEAASEEPAKFDVVGEDGRTVVRGVSRSWADDEATRISALTGEKLEVVDAAPLVHTLPDEG